MKKGLKLCLVLMFGAVLITGCSGQKEPEPDEVPEAADQAYPIVIDGKEIIVGETNVSKLLAEGFQITVSEMDNDKNVTVYEIDPNAMLDGNSYYSGGTLRKGDTGYASISMVTGESSAPMGEAVISRLEFTAVTAKYDISTISLAGVPLDELTREKAGEVFPNFTGDDYMWLYYGKSYHTFTSFDMEGKLSKFSVERKYDVDWLHEK